MKIRIQQLIDKEGITAAKFADEIGVQRSGVSHILSGRNNPGYDFIAKILTRYKNINADWLLLGNGNMYKTVVQGNLFDSLNSEKRISDQKPVESNILHSQATSINKISDESPSPYGIASLLENKINNKQLDKIVFFYTDKTFSAFLPEDI